MTDLQFDPEKHEYRLDGRVVPSVTQIITAVCGHGWKADEWYLERGRAVHHAVHLLQAEKLDWTTVDERIVGRVRAAQQFIGEFGGQVVATEVQMASRRHRYAGTADAIVTRADGSWVVDWKGSLDPRVELQLAGYSLLISDQVGVVASKARKGVAVELHDNGKYTTAPYDLTQAKPTFLAALSIYGFMKGKGLLNGK